MTAFTTEIWLCPSCLNLWIRYQKHSTYSTYHWCVLFLKIKPINYKGAKKDIFIFHSKLFIFLKHKSTLRSEMKLNLKREFLSNPIISCILPLWFLMFKIWLNILTYIFFFVHIIQMRLSLFSQWQQMLCVSIIGCASFIYFFMVLYTNVFLSHLF